MSMTLYQVEDDLQALLDTGEGGVPVEVEEAFRVELEAALRTAIDKRDRVGQFLSHCEAQEAHIEAEIKRLRALKGSFGRAAEKMEGYVRRVIESLGMDEKGRWRKLEGRTTVFSLRACPPSVLVTNEGAVPAKFKTLTITVPAEAWEKVADFLPHEYRVEFIGAVKKTEVSINAAAIKGAINAGEAVPGADLAIGKYNLTRK
jgi:hypothetical protein